MKYIKVEFSNERIIPDGGLAVVGAVPGKRDFVKRCNHMDVTPNRSQHQIKNGDILFQNQKGGVSRTYKGYDGYAPIIAYIGTEGYLSSAELRERKQHCQRNTPKMSHPRGKEKPFT